MAEVSAELVLEVLKSLQRDMSVLRGDVSQIKADIMAMRTHLLAVQQDISNIYGVSAQHDARLERIERRLDLIDAPTSIP